MAIVFMGALPYEFTNVYALDTTAGRFDADYAPGALTKTSRQDVFNAAFLEPGEDVWIHAKMRPNSGVQASTDATNPVVAIYSSSGQIVGGLFSSNVDTGDNRLRFCVGGSSTTYGTNIGNIFPWSTLVDLDIHMWRESGTMHGELFINGLSVVSRTRSGWVDDVEEVRFGSTGAGTASYSEIIATVGGDSTLGWRMNSESPDPAATGINTWASGVWGSLASDDPAEGVTTNSDGSRITGGFNPYSGPADPTGIRAVGQSARYIRNGSGLFVRGQMRLSGVNYDAPDEEYVDDTRTLSIWATNPATAADWDVSDIDGIEGGFRSVTV